MTLPFAPLALIKPLRRGSELRIRLNLKKPSGDPQPLTVGGVLADFTPTVRAGEGKDATLVLALTETIVSDPGGIIDFSLTPTQTLTFTTGLDYWVSVWVSHGLFTGGVDRLELHGKLDVIG